MVGVPSPHFEQPLLGNSTRRGSPLLCTALLGEGLLTPSLLGEGLLTPS